MVTEAGWPTMHCSRPAPMASLWLATALRERREIKWRSGGVERKRRSCSGGAGPACVSPGGDDGPQVVDGLPQPVGLQQQVQLVVLLRLTRQAESRQPAEPLLQLPLRLHARRARLPSQSLLRQAAGGRQVVLRPHQAVHLSLEDLPAEEFDVLVAFHKRKRFRALGATVTFCLSPYVTSSSISRTLLRTSSCLCRSSKLDWMSSSMKAL